MQGEQASAKLAENLPLMQVVQPEALSVAAVPAWQEVHVGVPVSAATLPETQSEQASRALLDSFPLGQISQAPAPARSELLWREERREAERRRGEKKGREKGERSEEKGRGGSCESSRKKGGGKKKGKGLRNGGTIVGIH